MEDEDGTCLLDVLCDPQALNDFLHGTNELQTEDLLISASSGEPPLFTDAPSPVSLLGGGRDSPDTPPPGCVDLSFLEEALLSSPEGGGDPQAEPPVEAGCEAKKGEVVEEVEEACDILQQSLQEAEITEQTMALEADLAQPGESLSMYSPAPLLPPPTVAFIPKSVTLPVTSVLPRDTQAAVEPPQPSLLAVGPGCPSLKPAAAAAQLMGLLPGNVFPAPSPETSFSLSPAQGSSMILHKAMPSVTSCPLITPTLRAAATAAAAPGIVLQRAPFPIQPKLPVSIQPRLVQISPKPSGQKPSPGLTFVPGTASSNILLSQAPGQKTVVPAPQSAQQLPKPVSLQLVNQGGSFVLQPQGLFRGQNQFLLPGQSPVTISQTASPARPLLTASQQGPSLHGVTPSTGQLLDGPQILTMPQRQLNFSPVFTPTGQLALRQATVLSGPLQLQSGAAAVFQMPAQLAGAYTPGGRSQRATLVHSPALGNHITLINSSAVLPSDLTSISIVNGPSVVQGLPFAAQTAARQTDGPLSLQPASVVLLPEERSGPDQSLQLQQSYGHVVQHVAVQPSSSPPAATVQPPPEPPLAPSPALNMPQEEVTNSMSQNQAFMQHLQQRALSSPVTSELLVGTLPVVSVESLTSPVDTDRETQPASHAVSSQDPHRMMADQCVEVSPLGSDPEDTPLICSPDQVQDTGRLSATFTPPAELQMAPPGSESSVSETTTAQACIQPQVQYPVSHQFQVSQTLFAQLPPQVQASGSQPQVQVQVQASGSQPQLQVQVQASGSQPQVQVQVQASGSQPQVQVQPSAAVHRTSRLHVGVLVPQQPPAPISNSGDHPAAEQPTAEQPAAQHAEVQQLAAQHAEVQQLLVQQLEVQQPVVQQLEVQQPLVQQLEVQQPLVQQLEVQQPAVQQPAVQQPAVQQLEVQQLDVQQLDVQKVHIPAVQKVQQHTLNKPAAALVMESQCFAVDAATPSPADQLQKPPAPRECAPLQPRQHTNQLSGPPEPNRDETLTPAERRKRFQQQLCSDRAAVQSSITSPAFSTLKDAVRRLLPYHACAGHLPAEENISRVDQEFDSVSGFLLKRTKDMVNKYRQLLVREAQQESPSAEMVMLERLFLQAERYALTEDRRRARREPETSVTASAASPRHGGPSSPPAWTRLSDRPPGLKTYRSSSRGALRLTIKQESGSRKVVHNSAHDAGLKRDHTGQLTNGGGAVSQRSPQAPSGAPLHPQHHDEVSNGDSAQESPQRGPSSKSKTPNPPCLPQPEDACLRSPPRDVSAPKLKCYRWDASPGPEPLPPPLQEDNMLSEHLQSAIDSILELQRLQGAPAAPNRAPSGPSLDQAITSIVEGHL